jgi:inosose dehydratase
MLLYATGGQVMNRRSFLQAAAALAAPHSIRAAGPQNFKVGMAATLWLQADAATETYWKACQAIARLGFPATEADNTLADLDTVYGGKVEEFRKESARHKVRLAGVYHSVELHEAASLPAYSKRFAGLARFLKAIGAEYIALGWGQRLRDGRRVYFKPGQGAQRTAAEAQQAIRGLNELGKIALLEHGIKVGWHPGRNQNRDLIRRVLDGSDPKHVFFCADVGHLTGAGYDALEAVKTYRPRLVASHLKDFDPKIPFRRADYAQQIQGDFVELGRGVVNLPGLIDYYRDSGFDGWVQVELDRSPKDPMEASTEMKAYVLQKLQLKI